MTRSQLAAPILLAASLVLAAACRNSPPSADAPTLTLRDSLRPVAAPELAGVEAGLQERIRSRYASLMLLREAPREGVPHVGDDELAAAYGEVGKLLLGAEFLADAEPYLLNARTLAPRELAWPYYLAHVHRLRNQPDQAVAAFQQAVTIRPDYVPALVWLGASHMDGGRGAEAQPLLEKAVALAPRSVAARFWLGRAALAAGDHTRAVEQFEAALQADPEARPVHYPLAMAYRALGDQARAADHLARWKEGRVEPDDPLMAEVGALLQTVVGYEVTGTRALEKGDWSGAAAMFREGLAVAPRDATLHQNLGTALFLGGDAPGALAEFEEALRLSPGYARAHFSVGVLMDASGRDAEAIQRFTDAVRYDPNLVNARFSLAEALRRTGQVEAALPHYEQIVNADPSASQARFGRAMGLVRLGRYRDARTALEEAVKRHPEQPGFLHALARLLAAAPDEGVRDGMRARGIVLGLQKQFGSNPALTETNAMALAELGRFDDASTRQREAIAAAQKQGRTDVVAAMQLNLKLYEARMPCRQPWADDDPVHRPRASMVVN